MKPVRGVNMGKKKKLFCTLVALALAVSAAACQQSGLTTNTAGETGTYVASDRIVIPVTKIRNINPATSTDEDIYQMTKLVYSSLIRLGDTMEPVGELASSWEYNGSGGIDFTLNSGILWSDGSAFSADDVAFTVRVLKAAGENSPYASKAANISDVVVHSDTELTIELKDPSDTSIADFSFPVFCESQFSGTGEFLDNTDQPLLGTGPYKIESVSLNRTIELTANEHSFSGVPSNTVTLKVMPVENLYPGLVSSGELSIMIMNDFNREEVSGDKSLKVTPFTGNEFETLGLSCSGGCSDRRVRQAVCRAVDRDEIIASAYYGSGTKSDDLYFPGYLGTQTTNDIAPDQEAARALLNQAGYTDRDADGYVEDEQGSVLELTLVTSSENESRRMAAQIIMHQLAAVGIRVDITEVSAESLSREVYSGSYDMFIAGWSIEESFDMRMFYHSGYGNPAGYADPEADRLLDRMFSGISADEMKTSVTDLKKILAEDVPYLCLCYKTYAAVTSVDFEGLIASRFNDYYYGCEDWNVKFFKKSETQEDTDDGEDPEQE